MGVRKYVTALSGGQVRRYCCGAVSARRRAGLARISEISRFTPAPFYVLRQHQFQSFFHQEHQAQSLSFAAAEMVGAPESLLICLRLDDFSEALKIGVNILLSLLIIVL